MSIEQRITPERQNQTIDKLNLAIDHIVKKDSLSTRPITQMVNRVIKQIHSEDISVDIISTHNNTTESATFFGMRRLSDSQKKVPTLVIDADMAGTLSDEALAADLIKTAAVLSQYPEGHKDRLGDVYNRALDIQQAWIKATTDEETPDMTLDEREAFIRNAMGEAEFLCDMDFTDWQRAVDGLKRRFLMSSRILEQMQNDLETFFFARDQYAPYIYDAKLPLAQFNKATTLEEKSAIAAESFVEYELEIQQAKRTITS